MLHGPLSVKLKKKFCFIILINAGEVQYTVQSVDVFRSSYLIQSISGFQTVNRYPTWGL
jgi:hypothetical protein